MKVVSGEESTERTESTIRRKRAAGIAAVAFAAWLALSYFGARPLVASRLEARLAGRAHVSFALVWPTLDVTAFGVRLDGEHFTLEAPRVHLDLSPWGLFGGRATRAVHVHELRAFVDEGKSVKIVRDDPEGGGAAGGADGPQFEVEWMPPIVFSDSRILFRRQDGTSWTAFEADRFDLTQTDDRIFRLGAGTGVVTTIPFERLTARVIRHGGHLLFEDVKLRCFNGMAGGQVDIDLASHAGAFNGELAWHFVEVEEIWRTYRLAYAEKRRGNLSGRVHFEAERPALDSLRGTATVKLDGADFYSPISFKMVMLLDVPEIKESELTRAELNLLFRNSYVYLQDVHAEGREIKDLHARGIVSFAGAIDMEVTHGNMTIAVRGRVDDPEITPLPLNAVTVPFDRLFREKIGDRD